MAPIRYLLILPPWQNVYLYLQSKRKIRCLWLFFCQLRQKCYAGGAAGGAY